VDGFHTVWRAIKGRSRHRDPSDSSGTSILLVSLQSTESVTMARRPGRPRSSNESAGLPSAALQTQQLVGGEEWVPRRLVDDTRGIEQAVLRMTHVGRPKNTMKAYDGKVTEYYEYCESLYSHHRYAYSLDDTKVYKFIFYQAMRPQKKRGGLGVLREKFDRAAYDNVMAVYEDWFDDTSLPPPEPDKPVGERCIAQYKTVIKWIYKDQVAQRVCSITWAQIWTLPLENLHGLVKVRRPSIDKRNYVEKVDQDFAPYQCVEQFPDIEKELWTRGSGSIRSAFAWLRHRFCLLFTTKGILRCESLQKAELSDFLGLRMKPLQRDVHPLYVMIMGMPTGKFRPLSRFS
jgi:hypothetical protein